MKGQGEKRQLLPSLHNETTKSTNKIKIRHLSWFSTLNFWHVFANFLQAPSEDSPSETHCIKWCFQPFFTLLPWDSPRVFWSGKGTFLLTWRLEAMTQQSICPFGEKSRFKCIIFQLYIPLKIFGAWYIQTHFAKGSPGGWFIRS